MTDSNKSFVFIIRGDGTGAEIVCGGHAALRSHFILSIWSGSADDLPEDILREADILGNPFHPDWDDHGEPRRIVFSYEDGAVEVIEITRPLEIPARWTKQELSAVPGYGTVRRSPEPTSSPTAEIRQQVIDILCAGGDESDLERGMADEIYALFEKLEHEADTLGAELGTVLAHNNQLLTAIEPFAKATLHSASTRIGYRDGSYFYASDGYQNVHCAIKADDIAKAFNRARDAFKRFAPK